MPSNMIAWIDDEEASKLIGLPVTTVIRYATEKKMPVRVARATRKAKPRFVKEDIEALLLQSIKG
jgi:hypothetical protein